MGCKEIVTAAHAEHASDLCGRLAAAHPDCSCESMSVSDYSPGIVADTETLIRLVFLHHWDDEEKAPRPGSFMDIYSRGLSVCREPYAKLPDIQANAAEIVALQKQRDKAADKEQPRGCLGSLQTLCGTIRSKVAPGAGKRLFCVFDTALANKPWHSDICSSHGQTKGSVKLAVDKAIAECFTGPLNPLTGAADSA